MGNYTVFTFNTQRTVLGQWRKANNMVDETNKTHLDYMSNRCKFIVYCATTSNKCKLTSAGRRLQPFSSNK